MTTIFTELRNAGYLDDLSDSDIIVLRMCHNTIDYDATYDYDDLAMRIDYVVTLYNLGRLGTDRDDAIELMRENTRSIIDTIVGIIIAALDEDNIPMLSHELENKYLAAIEKYLTKKVEDAIDASI